MTTILEIDNLDIALTSRKSPAKPLVTGGKLRLERGQIHALVGESGSGKTLMARSIIGLLPPTIGVTGGTIKFDGTDLLQTSSSDMRALRGKDIGYVFQEPMLSLNPALKIGTQIAEGLRTHHRLSNAEIRARSIEMLERVSLRDPAGALESYPHQFSGGMRQRIMLASVMTLRPKLLIADEPTTALDAIIQREVLDIMMELTADLGTSVLLITHDLGLVARYAQEVSVMQSGAMVESGPAAQVIATPREAYTQRLLEACPKRQTRPAVPEAAKTVLDISKLELRFRSQKKLPWHKAKDFIAVKGVSLTLRQGETVALVGESGSGKTTVGRTVMGLNRASAGEIHIAGERLDTLNRKSLRHARQKAQIVFQDPGSSLDPRFRIEALIGEGLKHLPKDEAAACVAQALVDVGLGPDFADRFPHALSGGQRQRVAIARAIVLEPEIIIADEAVSALDVTVQAQILDLLDRLQQQKGFAMLFITHDLGVVEQIADRVVVMRAGRIMETAQRDKVFDAPMHPYTRRLLAASTSVTRLEDGCFQVSQSEDLEDRPPAPELPYFDTGARYELREVQLGHFVALEET